LGHLADFHWRNLLEQHRERIAAGTLTPGDLELLAVYKAAASVVLNFDLLYSQHSLEWNEPMTLDELRVVVEKPYAVAAEIKGIPAKEFGRQYELAIAKLHGLEGPGPEVVRLCDLLSQ